MNTNFFIRAFLLLIAALFGQLFVYEKPAAQAAQWSKEAILLPSDKEIRRIEIVSPDKRKLAIIDGAKIMVVMEGKYLPGIEDSGVNALAELLWSPDSAAFSITESYGGVVGDWNVAVYEIKNERVCRSNVTANVIKSFKNYYRCKEPEEPNVGAVKWLNGGKHLLLVGEVPPHSSCPEMGKLRGYIVEISTGKIVQEFAEREFRANWGNYLGRRLSHK